MTLNIERDNHLKKVEALLKKENPDVACLQEIPEKAAHHLAQANKMDFEFRRMGMLQGQSIGLAILWLPSRVKPKALHVLSYAGKDAYGEHEWDPHQSETYARIVLAMEFEKTAVSFFIANTHFTWSPDGKATDMQRKDIASLLHCVEEWARLPVGLILIGDFNAPRGGEIYQEIRKHYTDHLPASIQTTLDQQLHRAAPIDRVVDIFFSTPQYRFENIRVISGVSDHCAVTGMVSINGWRNSNQQQIN